MTTMHLIVVIIILTWNLAILYLPFDKKQRAKLSLISAAILMVFCLFNMNNGSNSEQHICRQIAWNKIHHPETAKAMMAAFNVSEEVVEAERPTPIEGIVSTILALALLTPLLIYVVVYDDKTNEKDLKLIFALNIVASVLLLSLYYGLKLTLIPWYKNSEVRKLVQNLSKEPST